MRFIDSHTHLFTEQFNKDIDTVINQAIATTVDTFLLPNIDIATINPMLKLVEQYPKNCFPMMGLHPCSVNQNYRQDLKIIEQYLQKGGFCAVGEIGIDLYWDKTFVAQQKEAFSFQIKLAKHHHLPIVIHVRDAFNEVFEIIDTLNSNDLTGVFHCFNGSIEQAQKIIDYGGFKMGVGGVLTFKNAGVDKVIQKIDLEHLILETDSPYLAPTPHRGKRNESKYIFNIAEKLAEIKNCTINEVAEITTQNSIDLFGLKN